MPAVGHGADTPDARHFAEGGADGRPDRDPRARVRADAAHRRGGEDRGRGGVGMIFALVGNQNCGKTTLFNALTGSNQHVGNFPGVTVDQKMGEMRDEKGCSVVDLPGIYSLRPYTQEEIVSRDFIINQKPDGIINIVDATNIERNLYLTLQLLELRVPMVLALNMMDEVHANGGAIDVQKMSQALGIPIVPISAAKGEGQTAHRPRVTSRLSNRDCRNQKFPPSFPL